MHYSTSSQGFKIMSLLYGLVLIAVTVPTNVISKLSDGTNLNDQS